TTRITGQLRNTFLTACPVPSKTRFSSLRRKTRNMGRALPSRKLGKTFTIAGHNSLVAANPIPRTAFAKLSQFGPL
ncbi:hypothetical protein, partial [Bradyrhizobium sp.]|uniref:hypothetical protein n=1 Tax=Bradyrhizobium sp. TaxID=376 RepID=UPI003C47E76F